jgi:type IV secretory pathway component VirB8
MDASYELSGQVFEWDEDKARKNLDEHRVTFRIAATVYLWITVLCSFLTMSIPKKNCVRF